jgi:hypothetical protein
VRYPEAFEDTVYAHLFSMLISNFIQQQSIKSLYYCSKFSGNNTRNQKLEIEGIQAHNTPRTLPMDCGYHLE